MQEYCSPRDETVEIVGQLFATAIRKFRYGVTEFVTELQREILY